MSISVEALGRTESGVLHVRDLRPNMTVALRRMGRLAFRAGLLKRVANTLDGKGDILSTTLLAEPSTYTDDCPYHAHYIVTGDELAKGEAQMFVRLEQDTLPGAEDYATSMLVIGVPLPEQTRPNFRQLSLL